MSGGFQIKKKGVMSLSGLKKNFSIYCLQDIHVGPDNEFQIIKEWGSGVILNTVSSEARGIAVLFGNHIDYKIGTVKKDDMGNLLIIDMKIYNLDIILVVLYGPNRDNPAFYRGLKELLEEKDNIPTIICGDWNLVLNFQKDTLGYQRENNINSKRIVLETMEVLDLIDPWRISNSQVSKYTWVSSKRPIQMARLDFFLVTTDIHAKIVKHYMSHGYRTDHSFIGIEINLDEISRGKGFWKFNTSLLHDKIYVNMVKQEIQNLMQEYANTDNYGNCLLTVSNQMFFEMFKLRIRGITIPYSAKKSELYWRMKQN